MKFVLGCAAALIGILASVAPIQSDLNLKDEKVASSIKEKYLSVTQGWAREAVLKQSEEEAMARGRPWEDTMTKGLNDPLAQKILAAGEPSYAALASVYPGKVLDRTILGTYSDPRDKRKVFENEFVIWWNGAISAHLIEGQLRGGLRPIASNTNVVFRVGPSAEIFGKYGDRFSRLECEDGYLPIVRASYESGGVRYEETAFAYKPEAETGGWDVAYVSFQMTNISVVPRPPSFTTTLFSLTEQRQKPSSVRF